MLKKFSLLKRNSILTAILSVILCASIGLNIYQIFYTKTLTEDFDDMCNAYKQQFKVSSDLRTENNTLKETIEEYQQAETEKETQDIQINITDPGTNSGHFDNLKDLYYAIQRNPDQFKSTNLSVNGYIVRLEDDSIYLYDDIIHDGSTFSEVLVRRHEYIINANLNNDTTNKVLTGDYVTLSGIFVIYEGKYYMFNTDYEIITPIEDLE